jgi:inner membrane protein
LYVILGFSTKAFASSVLEEKLIEDGINSKQRMTGVTPFNILLWYTVAEVDSGYFIGDYSLLDKDKNIQFSFVRRNETLLEEVKNEYAVNRMIWFSNGYYSVEKVNGELRFFTLKFGTTGFDLSKPLSESVPFYYLIRKDAEGKIKVETIRGFDKLELGKTLKLLYQRVIGNKRAFNNELQQN